MAENNWWSNPSGHHVYILSWASLVITLIAAIGGLVLSFELNSSLIFVYGLENVVDFASSAVVLWRFFKPDADLEREEVLQAREKRASIGISIILSFLGFFTIITSIEDFAAGQEDLDTDLYILFYISFFSAAIFGVMTMFKVRYGTLLKSPSLKKDALCSAIGTILAISVFFNTTLTISSGGELWWLDPLVAISCGIGSLGYGLKSVHKAYVLDGHPIFSWSWWAYGESPDANNVDTTNALSTGVMATSGDRAIDEEHVIT